MGHRVVVLNAVREQQLRALLARLPPGDDVSPRRLSAEVREQAVRLVEDVALLLDGHVDGVLVRVPVQADLVAGIPHHRALLREGLERVARDEPRGFDVVLLEELEQAARADGAGEHA